MAATTLSWQLPHYHGLLPTSPGEPHALSWLTPACHGYYLATTTHYHSNHQDTLTCCGQGSAGGILWTCPSATSSQWHSCCLWSGGAPLPSWRVPPLGMWSEDSTVCQSGINTQEEHSVHVSASGSVHRRQSCGGVMRLHQHHVTVMWQTCDTHSSSWAQPSPSILQAQHFLLGDSPSCPPQVSKSSHTLWLEGA